MLYVPARSVRAGAAPARAAAAAGPGRRRPRARRKAAISRACAAFGRPERGKVRGGFGGPFCGLPEAKNAKKPFWKALRARAVVPIRPLNAAGVRPFFWPRRTPSKPQPSRRRAAAGLRSSGRTLMSVSLFRGRAGRLIASLVVEELDLERSANRQAPRSASQGR